MKKGIGIGSASIVLVFAVLCLTVFAIISYTSAIADKALVNVEAKLVQGYYEADLMAELILVELLEADFIPDTVHDVDIIYGWDWDLGIDTLSFTYPITDEMDLHVVLAMYDETMDIITWRMRSTDGWERDESFTLFDGDFFNLWDGW
jgi:hypothetical protein